MKAEPNSALFDAHEIKTSLPWSKAEDAIAGALVNCQPRFKVAYPIVYQPEIFDLNARQEFTTALQTSAGYRQVIIVGGQISDEQTEVFFKVFEYKAEAEIKFSIGNMIGAPASVKYVPISASKMVLTEELKNRVTEGEQMVINQIRQALSEP